MEKEGSGIACDQRQCRRTKYAAQHLKDIQMGADPEILRTAERHEWKTEVTEWVRFIRGWYPDKNAKEDWRWMFRCLYLRFAVKYNIDLVEKKWDFIRKYNIPVETADNVRMLNVIYQDEDLRGKFDELREEYEGLYVPRFLH